MIQCRRATIQDAAAGAALIHLSQGNASASVHGLGSRQRAIEFYQSLFRQGGTFWSYDMTVVAAMEDSIIGLLACYPSEQRVFRSEQNNRAIRDFFKMDQEQLNDYCRRAARFHDGMPDSTPTNCVYISSIAVQDEHRRRGVAGLLLQFAEGCRKRHQCDCCLLHVENENQPAIAAFRSYGFSIRTRGYGSGCRDLCGFSGYTLMMK